MSDHPIAPNSPAQILWHHPPACTLGEGVLWDPRSQRVYWVDILEKKLHSLTAAGTHLQSWSVPQQLTSIGLRLEGGFVGTLRTGFAFTTDPGEPWRPLCNPTQEAANNRFNDGTPGPDGGFWAGSMDDDELHPTGNLYHYSATGVCTVIDSEYVITNGPAFNLDGTVMYHTDTLQRTIYAFDMRPTGITNKRVHIQIPDNAGYPDGMTVDAKGYLWVCHFAGGRITRYRPNGQLERTLTLPVPNITCATFGGPDLRTLFVTTANKGMTTEQRQACPEAGHLFALDVDTQGVAAHTFG